jgi:hypothetical protein
MDKTANSGVSDGGDRQDHGLDVREHSGGRGRVRREGDRVLRRARQEARHLHRRLPQDQQV